MDIDVPLETVPGASAQPDAGLPPGGPGVPGLGGSGPRPRGRRARARSGVDVWFICASAWLVIVLILSLTADLLPLRGYEEITDVYRQRPGFRWREFLGTDDVGRSLLSRTVYGLRASVLLGVGAVVVSTSVALVLGSVGAYLGGFVRKVFEVLTDSLLAYPPLLFLLAVSTAMDQSYISLLISLAMITFPTFARVVFANALAVSNREFIQAARSLGAGKLRIIFRELIPNVFLPALSVSFLAVASVTIAEGSLSYLGHGIPAPTPSLGGMISMGRPELEATPHLVFVPGVVLFLTVYSLITVGERMRAKFGGR